MWRFNPEDQNPGTHQVLRVPQVTLRITVDGREETISEYLCDWPDCPKAAVHVVGVIRELRIRAAMCAEHAARVMNRGQTDAPA
jgi:hypothetical protein